ncbi:MAG: hypothetical protein AAF074_08910 [Pseudomonadota bacterium]
MSLRSALLATGVVAAIIGTGSNEAEAQAIACGGDYRVVAGDTLSEIAVRAYGTGRFGPIFEANRQRITSPQRLEIGYVLFIPCIDGVGNALPRGATPEPAAAQPAEAPLPTPTPEPEVAALPEPEETADQQERAGSFQLAPSTEAGLASLAPTRSGATVPDGALVKLIAVSLNAPFAGETLPEGGMLTELIQRALLRAPVSIDYEVAFLGGGSVSGVGEGQFDLGFPVALPNCDDIDALSEEGLLLCKDYVFSDALFSAGIGIFVNTAGDLSTAKTASDLFGRRLCRPEGMPQGDLAAVGLVAPNVNPVTAKSADECFMLLAFGDVDIVSVSPREGEAAIARNDLSRQIAAVEGIGQGQTLHVVSPRDSALGNTYLRIINSGLADMRGSGEYSAVVKNHLSFSGFN